MLGWLWLFALGTQAMGYDVVAVESTAPHPSLVRTEYTVQAGDGPLNQFSITHVRQRGHGHRKPLILLSPFLLPGAFYEVSETSDYKDSLAGLLARGQYDVWLVDQRRTGLAPGQCESGAFDCSVMGEWDFDAYVSDALFATGLARWHSPGKKPIIGGFSAGSNAALATINRAPHWFSGAFFYEGTFYTEDPTLQAHNEPACDLLEDELASGATYDPSAAVFGAAISLAESDPDGFSPFGFPPGTSNQQALLYVFGTPPPAGALSPTPNFVRMLVDWDAEQFLYSNQARLGLVGPLFDNYGSLAALRDLACGLSGDDDSHYDRLDRFRGDVLMFVGGTGFDTAMFDTANLLSGARTLTIEHRVDLGEADFYFHQDWQRVFYRPLRRWLKQTR